jgi:hypothetical protein
MIVNKELVYQDSISQLMLIHHAISLHVVSRRILAVRIDALLIWHEIRSHLQQWHQSMISHRSHMLAINIVHDGNQ